MMSSRMLFLQSSPSQLRQVALLLAAGAQLVISTLTFRHSSPLSHGQRLLLTCDVANAAVRPDEISVGVHLPQLHPVAVAVEVLGNIKQDSDTLMTGTHRDHRLLVELKKDTCVGWSSSPSFFLAAS